MQALFFAVKAGDVAGVRLLLENGARTDIQLPAELGALTPLHIAAALPGEEGVRITELLLHTVTDVDARVADEDDVYKPSKLDLLPSSLKLNNEAGPAGIYHSRPTCVPDEGGRTALHVACEREDSYKCARDIVRLLLSHRANPNVLWSGHSPLSLSIASGNDLIVKELLSHGADPNLLLTRGLGNALCVACDLTYEHQRSMDSKLALIDRLVDHGADILTPVTLTQGDKVAVGTAVDYGYFRFYQDRKIAHSPFYALTPVDREVLLARKQILEHMGFQLRRAVFAKESQWDPKVLYLSKRADPLPQAEAEKHRAVQGAPLGGAGAVSGRGRPRAGRCDRPGPLPRAALLRLSPEQHGPWLGSRVPSWSGPTSQRHLCWCRPAPLRPSRPLPHPLLLEVMAPQPPGLSRTISL
ncbi:ankyrin repeat and mynd [Lynx pardinus]|uniref:Ankyrin repeat and mynd n=1 Tax=Lynx pardinus TaxID=191816 RepID=A0A485NZ61_LYNPA|nr:ankyrin repeat and mynd [Lynx pardinus]